MDLVSIVRGKVNEVGDWTKNGTPKLILLLIRNQSHWISLFKG